MSALGQKQIFALHQPMSALLPKADMQRTRACPLWAKSGLMHRSKKNCYSNTSSARPSTAGGIARPSALAVLRLITSSVLVGSSVGRFLTFEDAVNVARRAPILVGPIRPIGDQAAGSDEEAFVVDCGQLVPGRQRDEQIVMKNRHPGRRHDQTAIRPVRECRDGALDLAVVALRIERANLNPERRRYGLDCAKLAGAGG